MYHDMPPQKKTLPYWFINAVHRCNYIATHCIISIHIMSYHIMGTDMYIYLYQDLHLHTHMYIKYIYIYTSISVSVSIYIYIYLILSNPSIYNESWIPAGIFWPIAEVLPEGWPPRPQQHADTSQVGPRGCAIRHA